MAAVAVSIVIAAVAGAVVGLGLTRLVLPYVETVPRWLAIGSMLVTAALFAVAVWRFGMSWTLPAYLFFAALSVLLAGIDLRTNRLPNRYTLSAVPILLVLLTIAAWAQSRWSLLLQAVVGGVVLLALFLLLHVVYPPGLGLGDVKLSMAMGLALGWLSWSAPLWGMCLGFIIGALVSLVLLATKRVTRKSELAFGPSMLLGAWVVIAVPG